MYPWFYFNPSADSPFSGPQTYHPAADLPIYITVYPFGKSYFPVVTRLKAALVLYFRKSHILVYENYLP